MTGIEAVPSFTREIWNIVNTNPTEIFEYLATEVNSNPIHVTVEVICLIFIAYMWRMKPHKPTAFPDGEEPTETEKAEMISNWKSEKLTYTPGLSTDVTPEQKIVTKNEGEFVEIEGIDGKVRDMATFNYLKMAQNKKVVENSLTAIDHYGVGSCGPRGFYGTVQPHLVLEEQLKEIYNTPEAIIYSFQYSTLASIIPAFSGRQDIIVADDGVNMGILSGIELSRSKVFWYKHNNMKSLEDALQKASKQKVLTRRWIVTEGVFRNYGDIAQLDKIVELKEKYKWRVMVDDSFGCGVLGKTGRGTAEHFGFDTLTCDVYVGSLDTSLGSVGGFCVGANMIVDHQRLSSTGYCFSASLPPYAAVAATTAFETILSSPSVLEALKCNTAAVRETLSQSGLTFTNTVASPVFHIKFPESERAVLSRSRQQAVLSRAVSEILQQHKISVVCPVYTLDERNPPPPSVRMTSSCAGTPQTHRETTAKIIEVIKKLMREI
eukprot:TRINITY_DN6875_c1_g1_i1.p1 TRINITY_DN6875_c1_g1~~TRINITY_DN6875_c1_g1_i1.p1  ORF type:complete len:492 (+),score=62.20 TRINITY_DN6875_c1_g1_i1:65-1540(+)